MAAATTADGTERLIDIGRPAEAASASAIARRPLWRWPPRWLLAGLGLLLLVGLVPSSQGRAQGGEDTEFLGAFDVRARWRASSCNVTLYENNNFTGWAASFDVGEYNVTALEKAGAHDNGTSSVMVRGNCTAVLMEDGQLTGAAFYFPEGEYNETNMVARGAPNDWVRSLRVLPGRAQAPWSFDLLCWALVTSDGGEAALLNLQHQRQVGVFQCEDWSVFSNASWVMSIPATDIGSFQDGSSWASWGSFLNARLFSRVWGYVLREGKWRQRAWTVKVDADSVFLPARLPDMVAGLDPDRPWYFKQMRGRNLWGPLELFSRGAVRSFQRGFPGEYTAFLYNNCEDNWIELSMEKAKASVRYDVLMLLSHPEVERCGVGAYVVYHPFKNVSNYVACLDHISQLVSREL